MIIDAISHRNVPTINALHRSTRNGFGVSLRASGLIIGASFI
ncbi:hypothetical protein HMPREF9231_1014 [Gardnerella vaginalis HMP9231]|nr:hypothetical protein HMPREF9231_1014 [Gardnerella vaginalis HMP9231]